MIAETAAVEAFTMDDEEVDKEMTQWNAHRLKWYEAMKAKGHMPIVDEYGRLNVFVVDIDNHNGPGCSACGWSKCYHCIAIEDIPECTVLDLTPTLAIEGK